MPNTFKLDIWTTLAKCKGLLCVRAVRRCLALFPLSSAQKHERINEGMCACQVNEISWNKAGDELYLTTGLGTLEVMRYPSAVMERSLLAHTAGCYCIAFSPDGQ
eukprot:198561-Prorocentrum_minimum.AAC.1